MIAIGAFEPFYFKIFRADRERMRVSFTELPYRKLPGSRAFLLEVRSRTRNGDSIAVYAPYPKWDGAYEYLYGRSFYPLAGRRVLAVMDTANRPLIDNVTKADYVAAYRSAPPIPNFELVWQGPDGVLLRRIK